MIPQFKPLLVMLNLHGPEFKSQMLTNASYGQQMVHDYWSTTATDYICSSFKMNSIGTYSNQCNTVASERWLGPTKARNNECRARMKKRQMCCSLLCEIALVSHLHLADSQADYEGCVVLEQKPREISKILGKIELVPLQNSGVIVLGKNWRQRRK